MAKNTKLQLTDIELLAVLVAKTMRDRGDEEAPAADRYVLGKVHGNGSTSLEVRLKLTAALEVDLVGYWWPNQALSDLVTMADEIADASSEARSDVLELGSFIADVAKEARRHVANARRRGLRYRLSSVTPTELEIGTTVQLDATMRIEMLNRALAPEICAFDIEDIEDVAGVFNDCETEQRRRAETKSALESESATGAIDAVVLTALEQRGANIADVLARMGDTDYTLDVALPGDDRAMVLYWDEGIVRASIELASGTMWSKGCITFNSSPKGLNGKVAGKPVKTVFDHPYIGSDTLILRTRPAKPGDFAMVPCTDRILRFDGRDGRVW